MEETVGGLNGDALYVPTTILKRPGNNTIKYIQFYKDKFGHKFLDNTF